MNGRHGVHLLSTLERCQTSVRQAPRPRFTPRPTSAKMCGGYVSTKYYTLCGCYGRRLPTEDTNPHCGCTDKVDLGVKSVSEICPRCLRGKTFGMTDRHQGIHYPAQPPDGQSTKECARLLMSCMPESVRALSKSNTLVKVDSASSVASSLPSSSDSTTSDGSEGYSSSSHSSLGRNLHWRAYDFGRYSGHEEQDIRDAMR